MVDIATHMGEIVSSTSMDGECTHVGSGNSSLQLVAEQLRLYKPTAHPLAEEKEGEVDGPMNSHQRIDASFTDGDLARERRAAVLICLFEGDQGELRVILTKRSYSLSTHPGEVALPGGKMEEGDPDDIATALREAMEEIGLDPTLVDVVALLEPFISKVSYFTTIISNGLQYCQRFGFVRQLLFHILCMDHNRILIFYELMFEEIFETHAIWNNTLVYEPLSDERRILTKACSTFNQNFLKVTPVVGILAHRTAFKPLLNPAEVMAVFDVPLAMFLKEENHRTEEKEWMGCKYFLHLFDFECNQGKFLIWGLTAGILIRAASVIYQRPPSYKEPSPDFQELQRCLMDQTCESPHP